MASQLLIESEIDAVADFLQKLLPIITTSIIAFVSHIRGTLHGGISGVAGTVTSQSQSQSQRGTTRNPVFLMINFGNYNKYASLT